MSTIIVLLILAGVSLSLVAGGDGIIDKASNAVDATNVANAKEAVSMYVTEKISDYYFGKYQDKDVTASNAQEYILEQIGTGVEYSGYFITKDSSGNISVYKGSTANESNLVVTGSIDEDGSVSFGEIGAITPEPTPEPTPATYTITYNSNSGTGTMTAGTKTEGEDYTIASNGFTAPTGYAFKEWNTESNGSGTKYTTGASYGTEANLTLYAIWSPVWVWNDANSNGVYNIGEEVRYGSEEFYVLADSSSTETEVKLITKYNLNTIKIGEVWTQAPDAVYSATACAFSAASGWGFTEGEDLNQNATVLADPESAVNKAREYAYTMTGNADNGSILTITDADAIRALLADDNTTKTAEEKTQIAKMLWGQENKQSDGNYLYYWLGSASDPGNVWGVDGISSYIYYGNNVDYGDRYGVRPVINISKSLIQ